MHFDNLNNIEAQALLDCFHKSSDYVSKGKGILLKISFIKEIELQSRLLKLLIY